MAKVAVVIGADQGTGVDITSHLCQKFHGKIYITTEEYIYGKTIEEHLIKDGYDIEFIQLDVSRVDSIIDFRTRIQDIEGGIDLLINNSCIDKCPGNTFEQIRYALTYNFYGNLNLATLIYPLLRDGARVINVTCPLGLLSNIPSQHFQAKVSDVKCEDELVALMQEYENAGQKGVEQSEGWGHRPIAVSKVAFNALTFIQQEQLKTVCVNSVSPGVGSTDAVIYLAFDAKSDVRGKFIWSDCKQIDWRYFVETHL